MSKRDKGRLPPFVPLQLEMMDCPAWRAMSHGAKYLYLSLKRRASYAGNRAFLSYRLARQELRASPQKIKEWYAELQHFGFIELAQHHCLGVDGKGKAPHWRLTEKGQVGPTGELPSKEFLRWDGTVFDPKPYRRVANWNSDKLQKQNPILLVDNTPYSPSVTPPLSTSVTVEPQSVTHGVHIERDEGVTHVDNITKLTTRTATEGISAPQSDPRMIALDATERRRRIRNEQRG